MNARASIFWVARRTCGAIALVSSSFFARPALALPLQEMIARSEPAVVTISALDDRGIELGKGSGFVVAGAGHVVTNHHVIGRADRAEVTFQGGKKSPALGVIAFDAEADLAT